jgi:hypothetical protein
MHITSIFGLLRLLRHFCVTTVDCMISRQEPFWKSCLVPSLPSAGKDTKMRQVQDRRTRTSIFCLFCMWHHFCVTIVDCMISPPEPFRKSCLVPSLPSTRRDTNSTILNGATFYSINPFLSSSNLQKYAASSPLFTPGVDAGILCISQHSHTCTLDNENWWAEEENLLRFLLHLHGECLWKQTDFRLLPWMNKVVSA